MANHEPKYHNEAISFDELKNRCKTELVIAIDEEYGYRSWLWFPGLPAQQVEAWWQELMDIDSFWGRQADGPLGELQKGWPGEFFRADESDRFYDLFDEVWKTGQYRSCIDSNEVGSTSDPDSFLERADKTVFIHKGATFHHG